MGNNNKGGGNLPTMGEDTTGEIFEETGRPGAQQSIPDSWRDMHIEGGEEMTYHTINELEDTGIDMEYLNETMMDHFGKIIHPKDLVSMGNLYLEYLWDKENGQTLSDYNPEAIYLMKNSYFGNSSEYNNEESVRDILEAFERYFY